MGWQQADEGPFAPGVTRAQVLADLEPQVAEGEKIRDRIAASTGLGWNPDQRAWAVREGYRSFRERDRRMGRRVARVLGQLAALKAEMQWMLAESEKEV